MILIGDALEMLRTLPDESVQCVVTSPPYYGLRDYGVAGQIGLEATPQEFIARLVAVFEEVRRVLKTDGTAWVNMGDSYAGSRCGPDSGSTLQGSRQSQNEAKKAKVIASHRRDNAPVPASAPKVAGLKPKDLMGMPWRLAFAMQDAGWWLRQDIIWGKPNPMPESVQDRCTKAHEYLFLLSKSERYYFDAEAIAEPVAPSSVVRLSQDIESQAGSNRVPGKTSGPMKAVSRGVGFGHGTDAAERNRGRVRRSEEPSMFRNRRSVWTIPTEACKEAHFATFPQALVEPCILAGSRPGDAVLDPFLGAGTTALVAERLGRRWIGCELNPEYAAMAERRLRGRTMGLPLAVAS